MDALIIYKWGYRICKLALTYAMFITYAHDIVSSICIIVFPTISWVYYFKQHGPVLVHLGVLNIVSWIVYFISSYLTNTQKNEDEDLKKELINRIQRYNKKGIVMISKEDMYTLQDLSLSDLKKIYDVICVPEEKSNEKD